MATTVDKRAVHTDALQTLGSIIGENEKRDAIHLAVEPVIAGEHLHPGANVGRLKNGTFGIAGKPLGIVDPFLTQSVKKGQRFWLIVYPRQITALHHVWEHPDFPAPDVEAQVRRVTERLTRAGEIWIRDEFVPKVSDSPDAVTFEDIMEGAAEWLDNGSRTFIGHDLEYGFLNENMDKFWDYYSKITGTIVPDDKRDSFFSCSC